MPYGMPLYCVTKCEQVTAQQRPMCGLPVFSGSLMYSCTHWASAAGTAAVQVRIGGEVPESSACCSACCCLQPSSNCHAHHMCLPPGKPGSSPWGPLRFAYSTMQQTNLAGRHTPELTWVHVLWVHSRHDAGLGDDGSQHIAQCGLDPAVSPSWAGRQLPCATQVCIQAALQLGTCARSEGPHSLWFTDEAQCSMRLSKRNQYTPCHKSKPPGAHLSTSPISTSSAAEHSSRPDQALWSRRQASAAIRPPSECPGG